MLHCAVFKKKEVDENCSDEDLKPQSPYAEVKLREEKVGKIAEEKREGTQHENSRDRK